VSSIGPTYFTGENVKFHGVFLEKNAGFHRFFLLFFEPPTPLTYTKAYLHYVMSLGVILLLIAMLTAGPDRLYWVALSMFNYSANGLHFNGQLLII